MEDTTTSTAAGTTAAATTTTTTSAAGGHFNEYNDDETNSCYDQPSSMSLIKRSKHPSQSPETPLLFGHKNSNFYVTTYASPFQQQQRSEGSHCDQQQRQATAKPSDASQSSSSLTLNGRGRSFFEETCSSGTPLLKPAAEEKRKADVAVVIESTPSTEKRAKRGRPPKRPLNETNNSIQEDEKKSAKRPKSNSAFQSPQPVAKQLRVQRKPRTQGTRLQTALLSNQSSNLSADLQSESQTEVESSAKIDDRANAEESSPPIGAATTPQPSITGGVFKSLFSRFCSSAIEQETAKEGSNKTPARNPFAESASLSSTSRLSKFLTGNKKPVLFGKITSTPKSSAAKSFDLLQKFPNFLSFSPSYPKNQPVVFSLAQLPGNERLPDCVFLTAFVLVSCFNPFAKHMLLGRLCASPWLQ